MQNSNSNHRLMRVALFLRLFLNLQVFHYYHQSIQSVHCIWTFRMDSDYDADTDEEGESVRSEAGAGIVSIIDNFKSNLLDAGVGKKRVCDVMADVYARLPLVERPSNVPCVKARKLSSTYTAKVTIKPNRIEGGIKPKGAQQARNGIVYKFIPSREQCCTRNCFRHFASATADNVVKARAPLFESNLAREELKFRLFENIALHLTLDSDGKPCCITMACRIYVCSRTLLYPETYAQTRSEANSSNNPKAVAICSWFMTLKDDLDVMPDNGWFMVNHSRRRYLWEDYMVDVELLSNVPGAYPELTKGYFCYVWKECFPEIRMRKYHRFSKCEFCVALRAEIHNRTLAIASRLQAKARLSEHLQWAHKLERGLYHKKKMLATSQPASYISIAIDGTDKFPEGFPHFFEKTKKTDGIRLKLSVVCVMVHGSAPYIFLAWESIRNDPNLMCEVLTRVLKGEEKKRGRLPNCLFLQLDNCFRENKNTYSEKYLEWLVERQVLRTIFTSFLPVGHTHFDCDQLASRIGEALRQRNVTSIEDLTAVLSGCYTPAPSVELIRDVLDWRGLLNPALDKNFPVGTSMCRRNCGIGTKKFTQFNQERYMGMSSDLHWKITADCAGFTSLQTRHTDKDPAGQWSEPVYHWDTRAPRPGQRETELHRSGLLVTDLRIAKQKQISKDRASELKGTLEGAKLRLTTDEYTAVQQVLTDLKRQPGSPPLPEAGRWEFACEQKEGDLDEFEAVQEVDAALVLASYTVFHNQNEQNLARVQRREELDPAKLVVGKFIAYTVHYTDDVPAENRSDFWVGKITEIDTDYDQVNIDQYNSGTLRNLGAPGKNPAQYKKYKNGTEWLGVDRLLLQFDEFTTGKRIAKRTVERVGNILRHNNANDDIF